MNLKTADYDASPTNTYYQRTVPGVVGVSGRADARATVTVNDQAAYRWNEYFWKEITVANSGVAVWQPLTVVANISGQSPATTTGNRFVPRTPESFTYDSDGNLTQDGRWTYTWDAENRLIKMEAVTSADIDPWRKLEFEYDAQGWRIRKKAWKIEEQVVSLVLDNKYLYDGWNLVAEFDARGSSDVLLRTYLWGQDLSGSLQGAGGVGGLLAVKSSSVYHFACYDGNGNLVALVNGTTGVASANYDYGPFGELIRRTGPMAKLNPFRFSTKYTDDETELVYYGYRYYSPSLGRWLSQDPLEEAGGLYLYSFVSNDLNNRFDTLGLFDGATVPYSPATMIPRPPPSNPNSEAMVSFPTFPGNLPSGPSSGSYNNNVSNVSGPIGVLPKHSCRARPGAPPKPNSCGAEGGLHFWPGPRGNPGWNFTDACNKHDICYGTCGSNKDQCDLDFYNDMVSERDKFWNQLTMLHLNRSPLASTYNLCKKQAFAFALAVQTKGDSAYDAGQQKACMCYPECKTKLLGY